MSHEHSHKIFSRISYAVYIIENVYTKESNILLSSRVLSKDIKIKTREAVTVALLSLRFHGLRPKALLLYLSLYTDAEFRILTLRKEHTLRTNFRGEYLDIRDMYEGVSRSFRTES
jgi:hypothetical protein